MCHQSLSEPASPTLPTDRHCARYKFIYCKFIYCRPIVIVLLYYAGYDECKDNNGGCSVNAICSITEGEVTCTCKDGFTGDGKNCTGELIRATISTCWFSVT